MATSLFWISSLLHICKNAGAELLLYIHVPVPTLLLSTGSVKNRKREKFHIENYLWNSFAFSVACFSSRRHSLLNCSRGISVYAPWSSVFKSLLKMGLTSCSLNKRVWFLGSFLQCPTSRTADGLCLGQKSTCPFTPNNLLRTGSTWEQPGTGLDAESANHKLRLSPPCFSAVGCDLRVSSLQVVSTALNSSRVLLSVR